VPMRTKDIPTGAQSMTGVLSSACQVIGNALSSGRSSG
jgi:hypothetical protein